MSGLHHFTRLDWSEQADQVSEFVRAIHQEIAIASTSDPRNDLDELLRKRLKHLIETGESAPLPGLGGPDSPSGLRSRPRLRLLCKFWNNLVSR